MSTSSTNAGVALGLGVLITLYIAAAANSGLVAIKPIVVGALIDGFNFSPAQAGLVVTFEMLGMGIGTTLVALFEKWNCRGAAMGGALLFMLGSLAPLVEHAFEWILLERLIAGFGSGLAAAVMLSVFAATPAPDRVFGFYFVSVHIFGAVCVPLASVIVGEAGPSGAYALLAGLAFITLLGASRIPARTPAREGQSATSVGHMLFSGGLSTLIGVLLYWTGTGAVWAFVERVGVAHGLSHAMVGSILGVSQVASLAGALTASLIGARIGRLIPLTIAISVSVITAGVMAYSTSLMGFATGVLAFNFMCLIFHTYMCGAMATQDQSGRIVVLGNISLNVGLGLGPTIGGFLASSGNFTLVLWLSAGCHLAAFAILAPVVMRVAASRAPIAHVLPETAAP